MKHPTRYSGTYPTSWNGYYYKEKLGYTSGVHPGVDYNYGSGNTDLGQKVVAIADGIVKYSADRTNIGFGNTIIVEHNFGVNGGTKSYSRYMHLQKRSVGVGTKVSEGQQIGTLGSTGTKSPHLHLELWNNKNGLGVHTEYHKNTRLESYVDPFLFIEKYKNVRNLGGTVGNMLTNKNHLKVLFRQFLGRDPTSAQYKHYIGKDASVAYENLHKARKDLPVLLSTLDATNKRLTSVQKQLDALKVDDVQDERTKASLQTQINDLQIKLKAATYDVKDRELASDTNAKVTNIVDFFTQRWQTFRDYLERKK